MSESVPIVSNSVPDTPGTLSMEHFMDRIKGPADTLWNSPSDTPLFGGYSPEHWPELSAPNHAI